jgi:hypothetical protein
MANKNLWCLHVLYKTVTDKEGLNKASVLELDNFQSTFSPSLDAPERPSLDIIPDDV